MSQMPDDELVEQVAAGQQGALLYLYDRYSSRVYAVALRILGDPMTAEEVTQDVFMRLWTRAQSYLTARGSFAPWLLAIARNAAIDRIRMEHRRPTLQDQDPEETWSDLVDTRSTSDEARWRSLYFAVRALPSEQRQVIELAYYQGLSHSEIAKYLGWPIGTVKTRLRLGMQQLRRQWLEQTPSEKSVLGSSDV